MAFGPLQRWSNARLVPAKPEGSHTTPVVWTAAGNGLTYTVLAGDPVAISTVTKKAVVYDAGGANGATVMKGLNEVTITIDDAGRCWLGSVAGDDRAGVTESSPIFDRGVFDPADTPNADATAYGTWGAERTPDGFWRKA